MREIDFLLTGSSGFLGNIIQRNLSPEYSIATLGRNTASDYVCDLSVGQPSFEQDVSIKCIIHAAGRAHVIPNSDRQTEEFLQVNFQGTVRLTKAIEKLNQRPGRFVFISTVAVYGRDEGNSIDEAHLLNGNTPYAKSKVMAEEFLINWCSVNKIKLTILRLPLVVGDNPPGNLGAIIRWMRRGLYIGIGKGSAKRSMVLAEDVAKFIPVVSNTGGIFNLTDGYNPTVRELEKAISKELNVREPFRLPEPLIKVIAKSGDFLGAWFPLNSNRYQKLTSSLTFSDAKARNLGSWNPRTVIHNLHISK